MRMTLHKKVNTFFKDFILNCSCSHLRKASKVFYYYICMQILTKCDLALFLMPDKDQISVMYPEENFKTHMDCTSSELL